MITRAEIKQDDNGDSIEWKSRDKSLSKQDQGDCVVMLLYAYVTNWHDLKR